MKSSPLWRGATGSNCVVLAHFSVKHRPARAGRNPRTGAHVPVDQKSVPFFKTGKEMRERLNRDSGAPDAGAKRFRLAAVRCVTRVSDRGIASADLHQCERWSCENSSRPWSSFRWA